MFAYIREGGLPALAVLTLGVITVALALRSALAKEPTHLRVVVGSSAVTLFTGMLGTLLGFQASARALESMPHLDRWMLVSGMRESLTNMVLALTFVAVAALLATLSASRRPASLGTAARPG